MHGILSQYVLIKFVSNFKTIFSKSTSTESADTKQPTSATTEYNAGNVVFFKLDIC